MRLAVLLLAACSGSNLGSKLDTAESVPSGTTGDADADADADADTDADTDADADVDTDTDTDTSLPLRSLILSEVCDDVGGAELSWVELYNAGTTAIDLGDYSLRVYRDGGVEADEIVLPASGLSPGDVWVVASEGHEADFRDTWGTDADQYGPVRLDGDDTVVLFDGAYTVDAYGEVGEAAGAPWDYTDATAARAADVRMGQSIWQESEWTLTAGNSAGSPGRHPADATSTPGTTVTTDPSEAVVMISEVVDHADEASIKYVELYNAGDDPVMLSGWVLRRYSNGGVSPGEVGLTGVIEAGGTFLVVGSSGADAFRAAYGLDADQTSGTINGNGNDTYELVSPLGPVDIYGVIGEDGLGTAWDYTDAVATRLARSDAPEPVWSARSWSVTAGAGAASPGIHPADPGPGGTTSTPTTPAGPGTLLITEVVDHADVSSIKFVELYNPGPDVADLSRWAIDRYSNGGVSPTTVGLSPVLVGARETWVIADSRGDEEFLVEYGFDADQYSGTINGNGNDVYVLTLDGADMDTYGEVGVDGVGTAWEYTDRVARRELAVTIPRVVWSAGEWRIIDGAADATPGER